ncbi:hypothetical protein [uncultured Nocardioides sp.]|uniref:hypothetical protein n=1 Tax=uncultured Nocardioides sp. TaxID=198441 RepID=UPI00269172F9
MAIPYPSDRTTSWSSTGQDRDHRNALATQVILETIDERPTWFDLLDRIAARLRLDLNNPAEKPKVADALLAAEMDLEWTGEILYRPDGFFERFPAVGGPPAVEEAGLRAVADDVLRLGWPNPGHKPSRTIWECFVELDGRYRHCDVYWAMHKHLKGHKLRVVRANWMLQDDIPALLADPGLTADERLELERELEADLVARYVTWLGRRVTKKRFSNGREADLYDKDRGLVIEAKANHLDDVLVAHAMGQAMYYRVLDDLPLDTKVAVLVPGRPREDVLRLLDHYDVGIIYPDGDTFVETIRP